jgi:putative transposase
MTKYPHRPPHIYLNKTWYFITAHTYHQSEIFCSTQHKSIWLNTLQQIAPEYKVTPYAWVLMWNHYHLLIYIEQSKQLTNLSNAFMD